MALTQLEYIGPNVQVIGHRIIAHSHITAPVLFSRFVDSVIPYLTRSPEQKLYRNILYL